MRHFPKFLVALLTLRAAAFAQTGFTTQTYSTPGGSYLRTADFNHDGKPDVLVFGGPGYVVLNNGTGGFGSAVMLPGIDNLSRAVVVDMVCPTSSPAPPTPRHRPTASTSTSTTAPVASPFRRASPTRPAATASTLAT